MNLHHLFPTPVVFYNLERELTVEEISFVNGLEQGPNAGNTTSLDHYLLKNKEFTSIREFIENSLEEYFQNIYAPRDSVKLRITQSWTNYTKPGQMHHKHAHPNSLISGVFYIKANKETDRIYFHHGNYVQLEVPVKERNLYNSHSWWLPVGACELVLFPSSLTHNVEPVQGDDERISLSFNTFPTGVMGENSELTELILR